MGRFTLGFAPTEPVSPVGFASLRFAFHPGDATRANPRLTVKIGATRLSLVGDERIEATVDLSRSDWQVIDIPLAAFGLFPNDSIEVITFAGNLAGTFYLDDIRLVYGGSPPEGRSLSAPMLPHRRTSPSPRITPTRSIQKPRSASTCPNRKTPI